MRDARGVGLLLLILAVASLTADAAKKDDWLPITDEERQFKEVPGDPGAPAVLLYRETYTDDVDNYEHYYYRIKILTEEGRKYGDVEVPFWKALFKVDDIKARTIRPDGTVVNFSGKVFEKVLVKHKSLKIQAKTFTLPEVDVGSIIEYQYTLKPSVFNTHWTIQHELFTRRARFFLRPYLEGSYNIQWVSYLARGRTPPVSGKDNAIQLELQNIPAFIKEEFMPPEKMLQERVAFYYTRDWDETPDAFWKREGKEWHEAVEEFIGKRKGIEQAVAQIVDPADPPETKLRKIYARVQQIRNLSYEEEKTEKEEKREKLKDNKNVEDVWKRGYGWRAEITRLFVALARAAGLEAASARISQRDEYFFMKDLLDWRQLNNEVAIVRVGNQERFFDPATPFCPFGMLRAWRTGVQGIRLDAQGGVFIKTPEPTPDQAVVSRRAELTLSEDGTLEGTVEMAFRGQEALDRRLGNMDEDEAGRRKELEDEVRGALPTGAEVALESASGWEGTEEPLVARFRITIPGLVLPTGRRLLVPLGIFHTTRGNPFELQTRRHAVYYDYPFQQEDEVTIQLPDGHRVETLPAPSRSNPRFGEFELVSENDGGRLRIRRRIRLNGYYFPVNQYLELRSFYSEVKAGDEQQAVLEVVEVGQR